jgi:uncharacterized protein
MYYLDACITVAVVANEKARDHVRAWLDQSENGTLYISPWVTTEVSSALSIKVRTKDLTHAMQVDAQHAYRLLLQSFITKPVLQNHFDIAARFAGQASLGLRAGDALHLAVAADYGLTLVTLDRQLADAGQPVGTATMLLS